MDYSNSRLQKKSVDKLGKIGLYEGAGNTNSKIQNISGYVVSRVGRYQIVEGSGKDGGYWFATGRGETVRFKTRKEAEEHAHLSS